MNKSPAVHFPRSLLSFGPPTSLTGLLHWLLNSLPNIFLPFILPTFVAVPEWFT